MRQAELARPEVAGVAEGVDRSATLALRDKKGKRALACKDRGTLDSILTVAPRLQGHWHAAGLVPNDECPFCPGVPETRRHMHWECPRSDAIRLEELGGARPDVSEWPPCLVNAGILPEHPDFQALEGLLPAILQPLEAAAPVPLTGQ